jgi:hypothetical protein
MNTQRLAQSAPLAALAGGPGGRPPGLAESQRLAQSAPLAAHAGGPGGRSPGLAESQRLAQSAPLAAAILRAWGVPLQRGVPA